MLRKMMTIGAMAMVLGSAACNTVTGPVAGVDETNGGRRPGDRDRQVGKVCLDDGRVAITSPIEGQILHNGQSVLVSLDPQNFCSGFSASIEVSSNGGRTFQELASGAGLTSAVWAVPQADNLAPVVRVRAWDGDSVAQDEIATGFIYREPQPTKHDQQRD